jgi:tRNA(Ile)-lysidine synthase
VALGHHRDDNAEMVLMNLLRGSGPRGLSGIPPVRDDLIVRPLMNVTRSQIMAYLLQRQLAYVTDASNADLDFTRNRIRHVLLPLLREDFNPNILATLHRTATIMADENAWIESQTDPLWESALLAADSRQLSLDQKVLTGMPRAAVRRLLRRAVNRLGGSLRRITFSHVDRLLGLLTATEKARVDLPGLISAVKQADRLVLRVMDVPRQPLGAERPSEPYEYTIDLNKISDAVAYDQVVAATGGRVSFTLLAGTRISEMNASGQYAALFDIDQLSSPLVLRNYRPGDRFTPLGMRGSKKLTKLFNERNVPVPERKRWPVLTSGPEILWVPGHQRSQTGTLSRQTRRVLEVKYVLPDPK